MCRERAAHYRGSAVGLPVPGGGAAQFWNAQAVGDGGVVTEQPLVSSQGGAVHLTTEITEVSRRSRSRHLDPQIS